MDPNPFSNPGPGLLVLGLGAVLVLGGVIYAIGAWGAARLREGRIRDETDIPFPDEPRSADDRETVSRARANDTSAEMITSEEQLADMEVGGDRKIVPQTPTRAERPVDAAERDKDVHQIGPGEQASPASDQNDGKSKSPL